MNQVVVRRLPSISNELYHHGVEGQKWGVRRYQNPDGSLTDAGRKHYGYGPEVKYGNKYHKDGVMTEKGLKKFQKLNEGPSVKELVETTYNVKGKSPSVIEVVRYRDVMARVNKKLRKISGQRIKDININDDGQYKINYEYILGKYKDKKINDNSTFIEAWKLLANNYSTAHRTSNQRAMEAHRIANRHAMMASRHAMEAHRMAVNAHYIMNYGHPAM